MHDLGPTGPHPAGSFRKPSNAGMPQRPSSPRVRSSRFEIRIRTISAKARVMIAICGTDRIRRTGMAIRRPAKAAIAAPIQMVSQGDSPICMEISAEA